MEPGVVNLHLSQAVAQHGLYYAPDPTSQRACTIGGNVAENAGGPHCLAYGVTTNHVLGLEVVLADGEIVWLGGAARDLPGYDLPGIVVGSEGTLCIVTKALVRLLRLPESTRTHAGGLRLGRRRQHGGIGDHRRGARAGGDGDDGPRDDQGGGTGAARAATRRTPAPCC